MKNYGKVKTALMGRLSELKKKNNQPTTPQFRKLLVILTVPTCPCIYIYIWIFCLCLCILDCTPVSSQKSDVSPILKFVFPNCGICSTASWPGARAPGNVCMHCLMLIFSWREGNWRETPSHKWISLSML